MYRNDFVLNLLDVCEQIQLVVDIDLENSSDSNGAVFDEY